MSNFNSPQENKQNKPNLIKDISKEISLQSKIGVISALGGLSVELSAIVLNYANKSDEIVSNSLISDLKLAGIISIIGGAVLVAERINNSSKTDK